MKIKVSIDRCFNKPDMNLKALARITIDNVFTIEGFRIMPDKNGELKAIMPQQSYVDKDGKTQYRDIAHPITPEARSTICSTILKAYYAHVQRAEAEKMSAVKTQSSANDQGNSAELKPQLDQNYNYQSWDSLLQQEPDMEMG